MTLFCKFFVTLRRKRRETAHARPIANKLVKQQLNFNQNNDNDNYQRETKVRKTFHEGVRVETGPAAIGGKWRKRPLYPDGVAGVMNPLTIRKIMRKNSFLNIAAAFCLGAAALAMTACSSEDNIVSNDLQQYAEVKTYTVSIPATFGDGAQTRAVEFNNGTPPTIATKFVENEKVYVYNVTDDELLGGYLEAKNVSADGLSCELKGTLTGTNTLVPDDKILLMYNLTVAVTESSSRHMTRFDYGYQQGTAATVIDGATSTMMVKDIDTSDGNKLTFYAVGDDTNKTQAKALFANVQSMFRFQFSDGTNNINVQTLKITSKKNALVQAYYPLHGTSMGLYGYGALTVNLTSATTDYIYLGLCFDPSKTAGDVLEFQVTDNNGAVYSCSKAAPAAGFSSGKYYYSTTAIVLTKHVPPTITQTSSGDAVTNINALTAGFDITMTNPTGVSNCIGSNYNLGAGGTLRLNNLTATNNDPSPFFNIASNDDLTLDITGTNTITCEQTTYCLSTNSGNLKLSGNGTLTVRSQTQYGLRGANYAYDGGASGFDVDQLPASGYTVTRSTPADNGDGTYTCTYTVKPAGALAGKFTINAGGGKVSFSKGNLQATYNGSAWSWAFAENQWDYIGSAEGNTKVTATTPFVSGYSGTSTTVDLFGWVGASSTWDGAAQYGITSSQTTNSTDGYGNVAAEALKSDWGNAIDNNNTWRTLTSNEWYYLFTERTTGGTVGTTAKARYTMATIRTDVSSGVNGIILFPDGVDIANTTDYFTTLGKVNESSSYATKCTSAQWTALAAKGCAFLPAAGYRSPGVFNAGSQGFYWSSSPRTSDVSQAYYVYFYNGALNSQYNGARKKGQSVRLVCAAE